MLKILDDLRELLARVCEENKSLKDRNAALEAELEELRKANARMESERQKQSGVDDAALLETKKIMDEGVSTMASMYAALKRAVDKSQA